ncbi:hypothetical protein KVR01_006511 [Diaporthe batatas]|uniref:uncharacterized protein n=1 Tax=Diaporthe batatas TaxID=748121 RepID=UPI001D03F3E6|nr:uncharacterized protein KVR01_006511 [Diaporthe batatas]KAG8163214.1 hypothetical protein KVR01_006511 [Diaporthe batatas]
MKPSAILTLSALSCQASARWLAAYAPEPVIDLRGGDLSRPTQPADVYEYQEYAPEPTPPPSKAVVDLLLHRRQRTDSGSSSDNTWENDQTCGWFSGISSRAYDCQSPLTCSTNSEDVVACATDGLEQFYTVCLNYEAVQSSKCTSAGPQTGCCQNADEPECGTYVWTGTPARSMFKCFATATLISMLDEPQFVIDASRSSASASSSSAAAASRSSAEAASRSRDGPSTVVATTTAADGSTSTVTSVIGGQAGASAGAGAGSGNGNGNGGGGGGNGGGSSNGGAIAGGVVGGVAFLALLAFLLWYLMRKSNKFSLSICGGNRKTRKEKNVDGRTYNKNNVKNNVKSDNRAYDERSYSNRNSYDNRAYDNARSYDNHAYSGQAGAPNQNPNSGATQGPTNQQFHFHMDDGRQGPSPDSRPPVMQEPSPVHLAGAVAAATAPALSRREQRRLARQQRTQSDELDPEKVEMEQQAQGQQGQPDNVHSHRYHPSSGQRYPDAPPPAPKAQGPDMDFIGRGM